MNDKATYKDFSDQELIEQYTLYQNRNCLGILLQRYTFLLLGVCMKYLKDEEGAKDAVQQVFTKAIGEIGKYPIDHFKSWIYTIARNHCFMILRHKDHILPEEVLEKNGNGLLHETPVDTWQRIEEKERLLLLLEEALHHLQPNQRECVSLFYLKKMSYRQVSEATGFNLLQVKSFIQNGKRNIRLAIEKNLKENAP